MTTPNTRMIARLISQKNANWIGMAAAVAGGCVCCDHTSAAGSNYSSDPRIVLLIAPEGTGFSEMGRPADVAAELAHMRSEVKIWNGIDPERHRAIVDCYLPLLEACEAVTNAS